MNNAHTLEIIEQITSEIKNLFPFNLINSTTLEIIHPVYSMIEIKQTSSTIKLHKNKLHFSRFNIPNQISLDDNDWLAQLTTALLLYD